MKKRLFFAIGIITLGFSLTAFFPTPVPCFCYGQKTEVIDIDSYRKNIQKPKLAEIAYDTWYIKLETKPECLIGRVNSIKRFGNNIVISNSNKEFLVFDTLGNYVTKIGNKGKGPGEYIQVFGMAINAKDLHIFILDNGRQKIIEYDDTGQFVQEFDNNFGASDIEIINGDLIQFTASRFVETFDDYHLHLYDLSSNQLKSWHKRKLQEPIYYTKETVYRIGNEMAYWQMHWDTLYGFNGDEIYPKYFWDLGKHQIPKSFIIKRQDNNSITERDPYISVSYPIEFESYLFLVIVDQKRKRKLITYNKNSHSGYCIEWDRNTNMWGFIDDISGIPIFSPDFRFSDNEAACAHEVYDLIGYKDKNQIDSKSTNTVRHKELLNIIEKSDITDNPIIQIARLK